jgi:hypothetical protein
MRLMVLTLPADFYIVKKSYRAYNGCIFFQVEFAVNHDTLNYLYILDGIFEESNQKLMVKSEQRPEGMDVSAAISFMQYTVGLKNVFNLFKEEIFEMVQDILDNPEYAHLRYVFLPI